MSGFLLILLILLLPTLAFGQITFERTFGGDGWEEAYSLQETRDGGIVLAGGTSSFGLGSHDFYVVKTDAFGDTLWTRTYGESSAESMYGMAATVDGGWMMAGSRNTASGSFFHLIRIDSFADTLWTRTFPGDSSDVAYSVDVTADGGSVLTGSTADGPGGLDFCLLRTDSLGAQLWRRTYGGSDWDVAYAGEQTADGGMLLGGYSRSFGGYQFYLVKTAEDGATDVSTHVPLRSPVSITGVPNPFFRCARLHFALPTAGRVRIVVYDIRGRRVATPFNGMLTAGVHALPWEAAPLAPGVYQVSLHTEQGAGRTKLLLLRSP